MAAKRIHRCKGQGLVEFSLFVSIMLVLLAAVYDLGSLLNTHLTVVYAARQGALMAASVGQDSSADCDALAAIAAAISNHSNVVIDKVTIYQAASDGLPIGGWSGTGYVQTYNGMPACSSITALVAQISNWPPANRRVKAGQADSLGVRIDYTYTWQLTLIGTGQVHLADYAVFPLLPS